MSSLPSPHRF